MRTYGSRMVGDPKTGDVPVQANVFKSIDSGVLNEVLDRLL